MLERVRREGPQALVGDLDAQLKTQHALQLAIQICIDVGAHLIAEMGLRMPDDYRGVFMRLAEADVLEGTLAARLADAAGLRNVLVHGYVAVDNDRLWAALERLDDLRAFAAAAERTTDR